jgi:SAM-dependent methyltransferase
MEWDVAMSQSSALVTAAEISRLAGVTRATVSNWRRRHADFPAPVGGTPSSPAYDLDAVRAWLAGRSQLPAASPRDELRTGLCRLPPVADTGRLIRLLVAAEGIRGFRSADLLDLPDAQLLREVEDLVGQLVVGGLERSLRELPPGPWTDGHPPDPTLIRALLRCLRDDGAEVVLDVLAEQGPAGSGMYRTPGWLAELMAGLLVGPGDRYPATVLDPACGSGTLLAAAAARGAERLFGQDLLPAQALQAAARLQVRVPTAEGEVRAGDSIRRDAFPGLLADGVLCNPPFGVRDWGQDDVAVDPRWAYGLPPKMESELAWVQHCLAHLASGGTAVVLLPPGVAERASGRRVRAELIRDGALRAVIALPAGALVPLHIGLHLWILHRSRDGASSPPEVLFVDAAALAATPMDARTRGTAKDLDGVPRPRECAPEPEELPAWVADNDEALRSVPDWHPLADAVDEAWQAFLRDPGAFATRPGVARAVPVIELLDEAVDLSPSRHMRTSGAAVTPGQHEQAANTAVYGLTDAAKKLVRLAAMSPWRERPPETQTPGRPWRTATVDDLLRGGALTLLRGTGAHPRPGTTVTSGEGSAPGGVVRSREGDIVLPELVQQGQLRQGAVRAYVITSEEAERLVRTGWYVLRPAPERFDAWFLAGFLSAAPNVQVATSGTTLVRLDVKRLRVPLLPLEEQRWYGDAFRQVDDLRRAAEQAARLADETARVLSQGLTSGALLPP